MERFNEIRSKLTAIAIATVSLFAWERSLADTSQSDRESIKSAKETLEATDSLIQGLDVFEKAAAKVEPEIAATFVEGKLKGKGKWFLVTNVDKSNATEAHMDFAEFDAYIERMPSEAINRIKFIHSHPAKADEHKTDTTFEKGGQKFPSVHTIPSLDDFQTETQVRVALPDLADKEQQYIFYEGTSEYVHYSLKPGHEFVDTVLASRSLEEAEQEFGRQLLSDKEFLGTILRFESALKEGDKTKAQEELKDLLPKFDEKGLDFRMVSKKEILDE